MSYTHDVNEARDWFAADAASSERAVFLRRTYSHLCGAILAFMGLEAIFLSIFVLISQNRADEKRQALADHQWEMIQLEEKQNEQLLRISEKLLALTTEVHALTGEVHQVVKMPGAGQRATG